MSLSLRDQNTQRLLDETYGYFGRQLSYLRGESELFSVIGRITVNDAEQGLEGQKIEVDLKGFNLRLRRHTVPDGFAPALGDRVTLETPFEGYTVFNVDGGGHSFGRGGDQVLAGLTPVSSSALAAPDPSKPKGLNLG